MSCSAHPGIWFWLKTKTKNQNISWNFLLFFQGWCHFGPKNIIFRALLLLKIHTIFLNIPTLLAVKVFVAFFLANLYVFLCRRSSKNASERVGWVRNKQRLRNVYKSKLAGKENWVRNKQRLRIVYKSKLAGKENWVRKKQRLRIVYTSKWFAYYVRQWRGEGGHKILTQD